MRKMIACVSTIAILSGCVWMATPALTVYGLESEVQNREEESLKPDEISLAQQGKYEIEEAWKELREILEDHDIFALVYLAATQTLWAEAAFDSEVLAELPTGHTVFIRDVTVSEDNLEWISLETYYRGQTLYGYMPRKLLACADEAFLRWETEYMSGLPSSMAMYSSEEASENADIEAFPESYRAALYALRSQHPTWIFVRMDTGLDWDTVIRKEMGNKSLIYRTYPEYMRGERYDDGGWYYAKDGILKYYMDPRNGLTEKVIFQFELLTYNETYHTETAVDSFLSRTFMNNNNTAPGTDMTYAHIFWMVGEEKNVSPFHLAARVYQEQQGGTSALISGTYEGFEGYYNYFNVNASGVTSKEIIVNGLTYAKEHEWDSAYTSIRGGAGFIAANYISKGQDTLYLQKYNVNPDSPYGLYNHQYMQNIVAPTSEGEKVKSMYEGAGSLNNSFVFKIPVYENMPEEACSMPTGVKNGWYEEAGNLYWYENDVKQGLEGRGKEIWDPGSDAWYWLDSNENGRMAINKDVYMESFAGDYADREDGTGKWVRYDENGHMVKGEDYRYGGWYRFDEVTGAMVKGWYTTLDGKRYYYDKTTGHMVHGYTSVEGQSLYFDNITGVLADCVWIWIDGNEYWFEGGVKQGTEGRGKEIWDPSSDAWYWLDSVDGGKKAVSKDVYQESGAGPWADREDGTGKWTRYDEEGHMVKGWDTNKNGTYYFDPVYGTMAKGWVEIDGTNYYFNEETGIRQ